MENHTLGEKPSFLDELTDLINRHSLENGSASIFILMEHRPTANSVDRHSVDVVPVRLPGTYVAGEEAEGGWIDSGIAHPANFGSYGKRIASWEKWDKVVRQFEFVWRGY